MEKYLNEQEPTEDELRKALRGDDLVQTASGLLRLGAEIRRRAEAD